MALFIKRLTPLDLYRFFIKLSSEMMKWYCLISYLLEHVRGNKHLHLTFGVKTYRYLETLLKFNKM